MRERPQRLRVPSRETRRRRTARWLAARRSPFGRLLLAIGRADQRALVALRTRGHSELGDRFVGSLGTFGEMGSGWIALAATGAVLRPERGRRWLAAGAAAPVAIVVNYSVKLTIGRKRPLLEEHPPLARAPSKLSFPSAHSTSSVAAAIVLGRVSPRARPGLYVLAAAICAGRPYLGMHYPSDVLAGVALGTLVGRAYPLPEERRARSGERGSPDPAMQGPTRVAVEPVR